MASSKKEKTITCPYNVAHQIRPERIQYHLVKCREQNPKVDRVICPYNATHHVPRAEEQYHISTCADRKIVELAKYSWLYDKPGQQGNLTNPVPNSAYIPVEEEDHQPTTDQNDNQQGVKVSGDAVSSLRRPALVAQAAAKAEAVHPFLQENVRKEQVAMEAVHPFLQANIRTEKVVVNGHAPLRRPGLLGSFLNNYKPFFIAI